MGTILSLGAHGSRGVTLFAREILTHDFKGQALKLRSSYFDREVIGIFFKIIISINYDERSEKRIEIGVK